MDNIICDFHSADIRGIEGFEPLSYIVRAPVIA